MTNEMQLPEEAYVALQALKDQASAVSANNYDGDMNALRESQVKMKSVDSWTKAISRKLMSGKGNTTIDDIDSKWLESQFIEEIV